MYKLSAKKVLHELVKRAIKTPVNAIKKNQLIFIVILKILTN